MLKPRALADLLENAKSRTVRDGPPQYTGGPRGVDLWEEVAVPDDLEPNDIQHVWDALCDRIRLRIAKAPDWHWSAIFCDQLDSADEHLLRATVRMTPPPKLPVD